MRLLDTSTKQLKTFYGKNIPEYAILSHMWGGEEDEVLFKHIVGSDNNRSEGKMRKGYAKIEGVCKQAVEDGWKYIWIDTCCIDKESSAELSEAINSMYAWYQNSQVFYVYLEDVRSNEDEQRESDKDATFPMVPFERSRWFSRGWTLQELIAPRHVVFYSKDWVNIRTKTGLGLRNTISAVTRIRVEMLNAYDPEKASVAEKLSWAAFRETTRAEDIAYCLMGLLGVNMPLLYGEGDRAFLRFQEEIMKVSNDDSLFAWRARFNDHVDIDHDTRGMLAASPWDFRDGMNIIRGDDGAYSPYTMTNQGLQIKLPLVPINFKQFGISTDTFKATLKCTIRNRELTRWVVIYLKKIREDCFQRVCSHWLDDTETSANGTELTSLLVPQIYVSMAHDHIHPRIQDIEVKILPTESGFTADGCSLVEGYRNIYNGFKVTYLEHQRKRFGMVIGLDKGIPWLDFTDEKLSNDSYKKGGSRYHVKAQYLDQIYEKIPEKDWWVTISVRKMGRSQKESCFRAVVDIQRVPIQARGWYIPSRASARDDLSGNSWDRLNDFKKEGSKWFVIFNPRLKRMLDVSLVYTFTLKRYIQCFQLSPDSKYLAGGNNTVQVYSLETGVETCTFNNESTKTVEWNTRTLCFSPDSKFIATGYSDGCIRLLDIDAKCIKSVFHGHKNGIYSVCFSPDRCSIISGSADTTIRIWRIADGIERLRAVFILLGSLTSTYIEVKESVEDAWLSLMLKSTSTN